MEIKHYQINHLVKGEDLNHHGTLFAGRGSEWFVEAGFVSGASVLPAKYLLCMQIHNMRFSRPVQPGEIVCFDSALVWTGKSRLISHILATVAGEKAVEGYMTFVYVDENGKSRPHGLSFEAVTEQDLAAQEKAKNLTY